MDAEIRKEFYGPAEPEQLGDPAADLPFTIRIQPPATWERRYDPATPRAVKLGARTGAPGLWARVCGNPPAIVGDLVADETVADWPVQHFLEVGVAMVKTRGPLQPGRATSVTQPAERGDMDVEAFRG